MNNKLLVIAGPTAVGKTALSIEIAKKIGGEIISADSMQVYKGLDIGTAKPSQNEQMLVKHHMIDICSPGHKFSVAEYTELAKREVDSILSRGLVPIIVGGTGLYIDNLIYENDFGDYQFDQSIRDKLNERYKDEGGKKLLSELAEIDKCTAEKLHENDARRIVRALEIYYTTGKTQSAFINDSRVKPSKYDILYIVLTMSDREKLYDTINLRVDKMLKEGLLDEAKEVINSSWYSNSTASQAIGYKEFESYFNNEKTLIDCINILKQHSRNYAKRQLTWFRNKKEAFFVNVDIEKNISDKIIDKFKNGD